MSVNTRYVVALVLVIVVIVASMAVLHALVRPKQSVFTVGNNIVVPPIVPSGIPIFVVGSRSFVTNITVLYPSAMPIPISSLPSVGSGSVVFVYWDYVLGKLNGNVTLAYQYLKPLMRRQVFMVFMARNSTEALKLEILIANAWALANGVKPVAIPIIPYHKSLDYVVIAPMGHVIIIAQTNKEGALQRLATWLGIMVTEKLTTQTNTETLTTYKPYTLQTTGETYADVCTDIASSVGLGNVENGYVYWFGQQEAGDGNGTFVIDYCFEMANYIVGTLQGGVPWTSAWAYNFIAYQPSSTLVNNGGYIMKMTMFQDAYSSYECYATPGYTPPEGECDFSGEPMGYLTIGNWYPQINLGSSTTTTGFSFTFAIGFNGESASTTIGASITSTTSITTPQVTISAPASENTAALIGYANNLTLVFTPNEQVGAGQVLNQYPMDTALYVVLPYGSSTTQELDLPVGSSALIYTGSPSLFTCNYELWGSGLEWVVFWPSSPNNLWNLINPIIYTAPKNAQYYDGGAIYMTSWRTFCW